MRQAICLKIAQQFFVLCLLCVTSFCTLASSCASYKKTNDCKSIHNDALCAKSYYSISNTSGVLCSPCHGDPDVSCCSGGTQCQMESSSTQSTKKNAHASKQHHKKIKKYKVKKEKSCCHAGAAVKSGDEAQ